MNKIKMDTYEFLDLRPYYPKIKILLLSTWFPLTMSSYFRRALERRPDVELRTVGIFTNTFIPWGGGIHLPQKYAIPPTYPLPFGPEVDTVDYNLVKMYKGDWKPDIVLTVGTNIKWKSKPDEGMVVHVGTDSHVLNWFYDVPRKYSDKFFNMQASYMQAGDLYLPYAYDPTVHYEMSGVEKDHDVSMIGLPYEMRVNIVNALRAEGFKVIFRNDIAFDEYREENNRALIGINWASMDDLNARAFEIPMMGQVELMNPVTDAFSMRHHYFARALQIDSVSSAVRQVKWVMDNKKDAIANLHCMQQEMKGETYDARIQELLTVCGFLN